MIKNLKIILLIASLLPMTVLAKSADFEKMLDSCAELWEKDLPKSAMEKLKEIKVKAKEEKNVLYYLKAQQLLIIFNNVENPDKDEEAQFADEMALFEETHAFRDSVSDIVDKAVINYELACMLREIAQNGYDEEREDLFKNRAGKSLSDSLDVLFKLAMKDEKTLMETPIEGWLCKLVDSDHILKTSHLNLQKNLHDVFTYSAFGCFGSDAKIDQEHVPFLPLSEFIKQEDGADEILNQMRKSLKMKLSKNIKNNDDLAAADYQRLLYEEWRYEASKDEFWAAQKNMMEQYSECETVVKIAVGYYCGKYGYEKSRNCRVEDFDKELPREIFDVCTNLKAKFRKCNKFDRYLLDFLLREVRKPILYLSVKDVNYCGEPVKLKVRYSNITKLKLKLCKEDDKKIRKKKLVFDLQESNFYIPKDTELVVTGLEPGSYYFEYGKEGSDEFEESDVFEVTALKSFVGRIIYDEKDSLKSALDLFVVDLKSGKPVKDASVHISANDDKDGVEMDLLTDADGKVTVRNISDFDYLVKKDGSFIEGDWSASTYGRNRLKGIVFTDRPVYRPGQTVFFKALLTDTSFRKSEEVVMHVLDERRGGFSKEMALKVNEFGSVFGSFELPRNCRAGTYYLYEGKGLAMSFRKGLVTSFRVEEYKRPSFEVVFDKMDNIYKVGDTLTISGRAMTLDSLPLPGAKVSVSVNYLSASSVQMQTVTDRNGCFSVKFVEKRGGDRGRKSSREAKFMTVVADVTSMSGETQQAQFFMMSNETCDETFYIAAKANKSLLKSGERVSISVNTMKINGEPLGKKVKCRVFQLMGQTVEDYFSGSEVIYEGNPAETEKLLFERVVDTETQDSLVLMSDELPQGKIEVMFEAEAENGERKFASVRFLSMKSEDLMPAPFALWVTEERNEVELGDSVNLKVGSAFDDAWVLVSISQGPKYSTQWHRLEKNRLKSLSFVFDQDVPETHIDFVLVKNGRSYEVGKRIRQKEKKLNVTLSSFRNKVVAGAEEEWTVTVDGLDGQTAEVAVCMSDAALDEFERYANSWKFKMKEEFPRCRKIPSYYSLSVSDVDDSELSFDKTAYIFPSLHTLFLCQSYVRPNSNPNAVEYKSSDESLNKRKDKTAPVRVRGVSAIDAALQGRVAGVTMSDDEIYGSRRSSGSNQVRLRSDFSETAFFFPNLLTDKDGKVTFKFDVPESMTRWNFKAMAHTKDMRGGYTEATIISQKKFTVRPNLPRFLRCNDECEIAAQVSNLCDEVQSGSVILELIDARTDKVVRAVEKPFSVDGMGIQRVAFKFDVPEDMALAKVCVKAVSGQFSDGEAHQVLVLPSRALVTETMPFFAFGNTTRSFVFESLKKNSSKSLESKRLVVEVSKNPSWYAVQAMAANPDMREKCVSCAVTSYYVNVVADEILRSNPDIYSVIKAWSSEDGQLNGSLLSRLNENQHLKNVMLEETPWVLDAEGESLQKCNLINLFDADKIKERKALALQTLQNLQMPDGSFCWFEGIRGSYYLTNRVLMLLGKASSFADLDEAERKMIVSALRFIDNSFKEHYETDKGLDGLSLSAYVLDYLYTRKMFDDIPLGGVLSEFKAYESLVTPENMKNFSFEYKAKAAVVKYRCGKVDEAKNLLASLREYAKKSDELGMFFNERGNIYEDVALLEAFSLIDYKEKEIELMKLWLLRKKQTLMWNSEFGSIDAVHALLSLGPDWLSDKDSLNVFVGGELLRNDGALAGSGYVKTVFAKPEVTAEKANLKIEKHGEGLSFGSMYWQYEEDLDRVVTNGSGLSVCRKIYRKVIGKNGEVEKEEVTEKSKLRVGEELVIKLEVKSDRDLDYVVLKDLRAACFEPVDKFSGVFIDKSCGFFYRSIKDASVTFFIKHLRKGSFPFAYDVTVAQNGVYRNGLATVQCMYSPEFVGADGGKSVVVGD